MLDTSASTALGVLFGVGAFAVAAVGFLLGIGAALSSLAGGLMIWLASALLAGAGVLAVPQGRRRVREHVDAELSGEVAAVVAASVAVVSVVVFFAGVALTPAPADTGDAAPPATSTPTASAEAPTPTAAPPSTPTMTATSTATPTEEERMRRAIREADYGVTGAEIDTIREVDVRESAGGGRSIVTVRVRADSYFDAVDIARTGAANAYVVTRAVYTNFDGVAEVHVFTLADFTDRYGNTQEETAVQVHVEAETAEKVDWNGLADLVGLDYKNMLEAADGYKIRLVVCEELDEVYPNCAK